MEKLKKEKHMMALTNTYGALQFILWVPSQLVRELFKLDIVVKWKLHKAFCVTSVTDVGSRTNLFENKSAGATPNATQVLVLITDGDPSDPHKNASLKTYEEKNIIRFVIGVSYK